MIPARFRSASPDADDVVLHRAFGGVEVPTFVELTAGGDGSTFGSLREAGWRGMSITTAAPAQVASAVANADLGLQVQALKVAALDLLTPAVEALGHRGLRPWVIVCAADLKAGPIRRATVPEGYLPSLFDGVNDFFVAAEHGELTDALSYPAGRRDDYISAAHGACLDELALIHGDVSTWRATALEGWENNGGGTQGQASAVRELVAMRSTLSWRITKPIRVVRRRMMFGRRG